MNDPRPDPDLDALFALARQHRPDTSRAEYAFETRLQARLRENRQNRAESIWAMVSWRMLPFFATVVLALGIWHSDVASETDDTLGMAGANQPEAIDFLGPLN